MGKKKKTQKHQDRSHDALCTLKKIYAIPLEAEAPFAPASSLSLKDRVTIIFLQVLEKSLTEFVCSILERN